LAAAIHSRVEPVIRARSAFETRIEQKLHAIQALQVAQAGVLRSQVQQLRETLGVALKATDACLLEHSARIAVIEVLPGGRRTSLASPRRDVRHCHGVAPGIRSDVSMQRSSASQRPLYGLRPGTPRPCSPIRASGRRKCLASTPHTAESTQRLPPEGMPSPAPTPAPLPHKSASRRTQSGGDDNADLWEALEAMAESMRLIGQGLEEVRADLHSLTNRPVGPSIT
jgi:hypothetical protein